MKMGMSNNIITHTSGACRIRTDEYRSQNPVPCHLANAQGFVNTGSKSELHSRYICKFKISTTRYGVVFWSDILNNLCLRHFSRDVD